MQDNGLVCWKCGASVGDEPLPLSRMAECRACRAQLHVCKMCSYYDTRVAKTCRETVAEEVNDKERANFCGYFQPRAEAHTSARNDTTRTRKELDALFGGGEAGNPATADNPRRALDDLFQKDG